MYSQTMHEYFGSKVYGNDLVHLMASWSTFPLSKQCKCNKIKICLLVHNTNNICIKGEAIDVWLGLYAWQPEDSL